MVWQVLDDVADGHSWDFICNVRWGGRIPIGAVAEAVKLARRAFGRSDSRQISHYARRPVLSGLYR